MRRWLALLHSIPILLGACAHAFSRPGDTKPVPDPRTALHAGLFSAEQAVWNLRLLSTTPPSPKFVGFQNTDLAFESSYVIQGSYNGFQIWDISNPRNPSLVTAYVCPAYQGDVSVYKHLLFVSAEGTQNRLDCGSHGVRGGASRDRLRGLRIFDISDIRNPKYLANVQTCRGSHTNTLLVDSTDKENAYLYISGAADVRPAAELDGCSSAPITVDPNTAYLRIEVVKVPLADPARAAIVSSPRIFSELRAPLLHGSAPEDLKVLEASRAKGGFFADVNGEILEIPPRFITPVLDSIMRARGGTGTPTSADSAEMQRVFPALLVGRAIASLAPVACHDITVYPAIGLAGGACAGHGMLLDIRNPTSPIRIAAVSDSNFAFWHSAIFNNDGTKVLFSDEWGGGTLPKCRTSDPKVWGADAIYAIENHQLKFQSYYKMPAAQSSLENCTAHNGALVPIPGRDVFVQAWYQGGISVVDWTDASHPREIAYFDRGPIDSAALKQGWSWSAYWYNGVIVSSEIARGLDILALVPSPLLSQDEIDAAKSVKLDYFNAQGQPQFNWPISFALARAFVDQLERSGALEPERIAAVRNGLSAAEHASTASRHERLNSLAMQLAVAETGSRDPRKIHMLTHILQQLAGGAN